MIRSTVVLGASAVLILSTAAARSGPVTWAFTEEVTLVSDKNNALGGAVGVGSPLWGC